MFTSPNIFLVVLSNDPCHDLTAKMLLLAAYVWSVSLIPIITELQQVIESFIKLAYSSLSFSLMKLDSCVSSLFELKKYIDAVFCQTLTGLVTSFYLTLSEHFTDSIYMQQLKEIGFLAHFECLLNSTGEEIGLLEDMYVGVMEMKNIKFQVGIFL
jgi:inositol polyphosphate-4-phosphatase